MQRGLALMCALSIGMAGCHHWYGRGLIAAAGGVTVGAGLGAILPCSETEPDCRGDTVTKMMVISGAMWTAGWAAFEVALALKIKPSDSSSSSSYEDYSTPTTSYTPDSSSETTGSSEGCQCQGPYDRCIEADVGDGSGRKQCEEEFEACLTTYCGGHFEHDDLSGDSGGTSGTVPAE